MTRAGGIVLALALAGCGAESHPADGGGDMPCACLPDFAMPDLAPPADLAPPPDLVAVPDLGDLPDIALGDAPAHCKANAGYAGMNTCGEEGTCLGHKYTLDCDGQTCRCAVDGALTQMFAQGNACNDIDGTWTTVCNF